MGFFPLFILLFYVMKQNKYPWVSLSHRCSPWNSYLPLSCHFWSCPEVLWLIAACRKLCYFLTQSTRWYRNALLISFCGKGKYLNLDKIVQAYRITYFWLCQNPLLLCEFCTSLTTLAIIHFMWYSLYPCVCITVNMVYFLFVCDLGYS